MTRRRLITLIGLASLTACLLAQGVALSRVRNRLSSDFVDEYGQQELVIAKQVSQQVSLEVAGIQKQLELASHFREFQDADPAQCASKLKEVFSVLSSSVGNVGRVGRDRTFVCSANPALTGTDARSLGPYVDQIFDDPKHAPVLSRLSHNPQGQLFVALHVPVFAADGTFAGTLGGAIYLTQLQKKFLENVSLAQQGYVSMDDDNGDILYHPTTSLVGQNFWTLQEKLGYSQDLRRIISDASVGHMGILRYAYSGQNKIGAYVGSPVFPGRYWPIVVTIPVAQAQATAITPASLQEFTNLNLIGLLAAIPFLLLLFSLNRKVFQPLDTVAAASRRFGRGELGARIPFHGNDELGQLGQAFNAMAERIQSTHSILANQVEYQTAELAGKVTELGSSNASLHEANSRVEEERNRYEAILESIGEGTVVTDSQGHILLLNHAAERLLGWTSEDALNKLWGKDLPPISGPHGAPVPQEELAIYRALASSKRVTASYDCTSRTGRRFPISATASPILRDGTVIGVVSVFRDTTEETRMDKAKSEFVSLASHQLRTPISAINWFTEMLLNGDVGGTNPKQHQYLELIYGSSQRMARLINDLLNVSRLDMGAVTAAAMPVDLAVLIQSVRGELEQAAGAKSQLLEVDIEPNLPVLLSDATLLREIVENLLSNAIKYTPPKGSVRLAVSYMEPDSIMLTVADTGMGIPTHQQAQIFTKMFRADNAAESDASGSGLGLYVAQEMAAKLGGVLEFRSEEGRGTLFTLILPISLKIEPPSTPSPSE